MEVSTQSYPIPHNSQEKGTAPSRVGAAWTPASGSRWNRACNGMWEPRPRYKYTVCGKCSTGTCCLICEGGRMVRNGGRLDGSSRAMDE